MEIKIVALAKIFVCQWRLTGVVGIGGSFERPRCVTNVEILSDDIFYTGVIAECVVLFRPQNQNYPQMLVVHSNSVHQNVS